MATFKTRAQFVADDLRKRILGGEFKGGTQLRQDALAKDYDVSRIPVREALLTLESEGLVEFYAHRGAFTTELSVSKIRELFELRTLLETYVLRHAITRLSDADLKKAEEILRKYDEALNSGGEIDNWSEYNYAFHLALYEPAELPETLSLISQLNTKSDRYIRMQLLYTQEIEKAEREHHKLLDLARQGDADKACDLLKTHIQEACEGIVELLEERARRAEKT
ncbi:GntR family transcriptional regulator [Bisbaumannia pacifica]|uniref:GntR family transcriptional regulator n=1 Tax=Bisbaumannia pacifica TaxID=77098 RepID=A0A510XBA3_9GAMM|nr:MULTISPECIES: GntR family transcriptional regulator [Halomonas]MBH8580150.1 GntR family transcriptional regulator [Halomonas pacifica]GEK48291.1 transcription regulator [Halomonas pacifica]GKW47950.1 transcription regulator [Halomonas sp. NCCP-2165]